MNKVFLPLPRKCGAPLKTYAVTPHSADAHDQLIMASKRFSQGIDFNPEGKGSEIVRAVVTKVESVFPTPGFAPGSTFLRLIAYVETKDGADSSTYRSGFDGGIWQVQKKAFDTTKDTKTYPDLIGKHDEIKKRFGIDWMQVQWKDLRKPLVSGFAARLVLCNIPIPIPVELEGQAKFWNNQYRPVATEGAEKKFVDDVLALVSEDLL